MLKKCLQLSVVLLFLILLTSTVHAEQIYYLAQEGLTGEVNMNTYLSEGQVMMLTGPTINKKAVPGPAPVEYPGITIWEQGIETLGKDHTVNDRGLQFTGQNWSPGSKVLVIWKIRIYNAPQRMPIEFKQDLNVALWVDWNQDGTWAPAEKMICSSFNIYDLFPFEDDHIEIRYLSWFDIPEDTDLFVMNGKKAPETPNKSEKSVWIRGLLSYDDPDASPDGNCLFGEYEDYLVTYKVITPASM